MKINVLVFPENRKINPYQNLLYKNIMSIKDVKIKFFDASFFGHTRIPLGIFNFFIPIKLFKYRLEGYNIFHLHWFGPLHLPTENVILRFISTINLMIFLVYVKYFLSYKIVWTVHEILPPRKEFIHDLLIRKIVSNITDANIVQSKSTLGDLKKLKFNTLKTYLIPHGTYIGTYENKISKEQARKYFQLNPDDYVFLFLGTISKHKGLDYLLETFSKLPKTRNTKLLIAGENNYRNINQLLNKYRSLLGEHIIIHLGVVPEKHLQYYYNCSDTVVLPFVNTTNSGSALLALSFKKFIIAPRIGNLRDMPDELGYFYDIDDSNGLFKSMINAMKQKSIYEINKKSALNNYVSKIPTWSEISEQTLKIYKKILQK